MVVKQGLDLGLMLVFFLMDLMLVFLTGSNNKSSMVMSITD